MMYPSMCLLSVDESFDSSLLSRTNEEIPSTEDLSDGGRRLALGYGSLSPAHTAREEGGRGRDEEELEEEDEYEDFVPAGDVKPVMDIDDDGVRPAKQMKTVHK